MQNSKTNTILLVVLIILVIGFGTYLIDNKKSNQAENPIYGDSMSPEDANHWDQFTIPNPSLNDILGNDGQPLMKDTYTYTNHGFSIELPKGFVPKEIQGETGPTISIEFPNKKGWLIYITNVTWWEKNNITGQADLQGTEKVGTTIFKTYKYKDQTEKFYIFRQGNVAYLFNGDSREYMETFKFIGWPQVEGNKEDLVSFSIKPGQEVSGVVKATGVLSGGYFFEGNLPVAILDANKNVTSFGPGHGQATTDWMTAGPVSFTVDFDFTKVPKGKYYIKLTQDDPSDGANGFVPGFVLIPVIVK